MYVEDVFSISGRGTVATGKVERGVITKGAEIEIVGMGAPRKTVLTGIGESQLQGDWADWQKCSTRSSTEERRATTWVLCCEV